ncbi:MAG: Ig-like domain-containing protein [candidate division WOR-3 bacterium]|nr:Ig-like domain-containing protein [candidate division WOR-3 bacterium]
MNQRYILVVSILAVVLLACAKKMLPPSPDRFPPHLQEVDTRTRSQVALVFDEEIDGARLSPDSFRLTGPAGETLALRGASLGRSSDEVQLWTPTQEPKLYDVRGIVWDRAGNPARFRARFRGSSKPDTIPPRVTQVVPSPGSARQKRGVAVRVTFSEAIDTTSLGTAGETLGTVPVRGQFPYMFVPAEYDTQFKRSWASDWQTLNFTRLESLPTGAVIYFLLQRRVMDLERNLVQGPAFTYFASDSVFDGVPVKGKAKWHDAPLSTGTVLFQAVGLGDSPRSGTVPLESVPAETVAVHTTGLAPVLTDGSFSTRVKKGEYEVVAVADTNGDGLVDLVSPALKFNTDAESLSLFFEPESLPRPINAYRR